MKAASQVDSKQNTRMMVGGWATLILGLYGLAANYYLFLGNYQPIIKAYADLKKMASVRLLGYVYPAVHDIAVIAAIALIIAGYGFFTRKSWAWLLAVSATAAGLVGAWLPIVWPLMISLPVKYAAIFAPYLFLWLLLVGYVRPVGTKTLILSLFSGIAMVLASMSGTAALTKIIGTKLPIYIGTQQLNWVAMLLFGIFTVAILTKRSWALPVGLVASTMSVMAGYPLAYFDSIETQEFSLFTIGPTVSLLILVSLVIWGAKLWDAGAEDAPEEAEQRVAS